MPIVHVYAFERSIEKKREIVKGITEVTCKAYDVSPEIVTVYIFDVPKTNAAHVGVLESDRIGLTAPAKKAKRAKRRAGAKRRTKR